MQKLGSDKSYNQLSVFEKFPEIYSMVSVATKNVEDVIGDFPIKLLPFIVALVILVQGVGIMTDRDFLCQ